MIVLKEAHQKNIRQRLKNFSKMLKSFRMEISGRVKPVIKK